jgi:hypothetical protein
MLRPDYGLMLEPHFRAFEDHIEEGVYQFKIKLNPRIKLRTKLNLVAINLKTIRITLA